MNRFKLIIHLVIVLLSIFHYKILRIRTDGIEEDPDRIKKADNKNLALHQKKFCSSSILAFISIIKISLKHLFFYKENRSCVFLSNLTRCSLFFLAVTLLAISLPHNSFALTASEQREAQQQDIQAKQRIESERRDIIRQKESEEIKNIGKRKFQAEEQLESKKKADDKVCQTIKTFEIQGNKEILGFTLKRKFIKPLQKEKPDLCFTRLDLSKLHDQIENYYINQGYVIARVYFDASKIAKGKIKIVIEEGKLEKLEIRDNSKLNNVLPFRRTTQKFFAFPSLWKNEAVNLRDIEQGIDQINRLSSQNAKISLDPSEKEGYSNVIIDNQIGHLATVSLGVDNSGQQSTGRIKRKASINYDNLLGINDNIYLNYSQSNGVPLFGSSKGFNNEIGTNDNSNTRFSKAFYSAFSVPFGYWTAGTSYSYSKYLLTTAGTASLIKSSGNSEAKTYYLDRVLSRGKKYKISLKAELGQNDTDSYIEDTYIPVNSRRTTQANLYLNNTFYIPNGSLYFQPKYSKGLTAFGAMKDQKGLTADKPRAQFETFGLYAQSNLNFNLPLFRGSESSPQRDDGGSSSPKTAIPLNHKLTFDSLKSNDSLYGSDQFSLGGRYTIRGFQESIISGDNGYLFRNDLSARLSDLTPKSLLNSKIFGFGGENFSANSAISKMRFGIFHDYGYVRNHVIDSSNDEGYMSGAGAVLSFNGKFINWDVTYSKGLHSPQFLRNLDNIPKDNETIYFSLGVNLGLL